MLTNQPTNSMKTVFLSYSSKDKPFVQELAEDIKRMGIGVWFDQWEIKVGDSIIDKVSKGLKENDLLAVVLSPDSVNSEWVKRELNAILMKEISERQVAVFPVLYKECEIPILLREKKYANFTKSYEDGLKELLAAISPEDFNDSSDLSRQLSDYYVRQAIKLEQTSKTQEAANYYERAISVCPTNPMAYYDYGVFKMTAGQEEAAKTLFVKTLVFDSVHKSALINLGVLSIEKDPAAAVKYLESAKKLDNKNYACVRQLGQAYIGIGNSQKALDAFLDAASLAPDLGEFAAVMYLISFIYKYENELGAYLAYDEEFILTKEKTGKHVDFDEYRELCDGFVQINHINKAIEYFQKAASAYDGDKRLESLETKINNFGRTLQQLDQQAQERGQRIKDIVTGERLKYETCRADLLHGRPTYSSLLDTTASGQKILMGSPLSDFARGAKPPQFAMRNIADRSVLSRKKEDLADYLDQAAFPEIRALVESLTESPPLGRVERVPNIDEEIYRVKVNDGIALCSRRNDGWSITIYNQQKEPIIKWRNDTDEYAQASILLIDSFIQNNQQSTNPAFVKERIEVKNDIRRKYFNSDLGRIIVHTHRHPIGTEGVIEIAAKNLILRYLWERATGKIDPANLQELKTLPF